MVLPQCESIGRGKSLTISGKEKKATCPEKSSTKPPEKDDDPRGGPRKDQKTNDYKPGEKRKGSFLCQNRGSPRVPISPEKEGRFIHSFFIGKGGGTNYLATTTQVEKSDHYFSVGGLRGRIFRRKNQAYEGPSLKGGLAFRTREEADLPIRT